MVNKLNCDNCNKIMGYEIKTKESPVKKSYTMVRFNCDVIQYGNLQFCSKNCDIKFNEVPKN